MVYDVIKTCIVFLIMLKQIQYLQNADENEVRDGEEPREVSKATKALRQKAKVLGRFKGLGKVSSEQASEVGSEESGEKYSTVVCD